MQLRYEVRKNKQGEEYCITPCPLGKLTMGVARIMVGSCNCPHCKLYVSDDPEAQVQTCRCERKMTAEQISELIQSGRALPMEIQFDPKFEEALRKRKS
jgi:ssDNA-binding Zn-finger/Zn-ribbon topoisomerase 1